jgi:hypothetical protein
MHVRHLADLFESGADGIGVGTESEVTYIKTISHDFHFSIRLEHAASGA